jgi:hypothetical protein
MQKVAIIIESDDNESVFSEAREENIPELVVKNEDCDEERDL